ncbi:MAG: hypothetical protein AAFR87_19605 [Bacteroidota bacterium]
MMNFEEFSATLSAEAVPALSQHLEALWWDAKGNWDKAHHLADRVIQDSDGDWIHAYLHRKEGDSFNAGYWYNRAAKPRFQGSLDEEWEELVRYFLQKG